MKTDHSIGGLCRAFEVSPSGYYDWCRRQRQPGPRAQEDQKLREEIGRIHHQSRQTYGAPRIQAVLRSRGLCHGRNRLGRLMRQQHICGRARRRYRVRTTDSQHDQPIAPNRLASHSGACRPNEVWAADITYIPTEQGWLYVAAILDLYSRRIVGWAASQRIDTPLVMAAWTMALVHRKPPAGLLFHSDRGVQYASLQYRKALDLAQAIASMSRKANCYDNAIMESFWSTLKMELLYGPGRTFASAEQARAALFEYIEVFYNNQRLHSSLGFQAPAQFELAHN